MRVLGIDYGTKRIGVAIGDTDTKTAVPLLVLDASSQKLEAINQIEEIIRKEEIGLVVVGMPTNMDSSQSETGYKVDKFVAELKNKFKIRIEIQDERLSTKQIEQVTKEYGFAKKGIDKDSAAAALILQSFLERLE